jgi:hypothetical protein
MVHIARKGAMRWGHVHVVVVVGNNRVGLLRLSPSAPSISWANWLNTWGREMAL